MLLGAAAVVLVVGAALGLIRAEGSDPVISFDALNYQLPQVARWIQSGSMWQLDQMFPDYSNATYPHHGNLLLLAVMLPVSDDTLARFVPIPYAGLGGLAVYAAALELGASRGWALLASATPLAIPIFVRVALEGTQTDTPFYFFFTAAALFLLRHHRTAARSDLVLAGLALGLALGTKWYALTTIPVLLIVWALARWRGRLRWWRDGLRLVGLIALGGGIWLVRNAVETGNPLYPQPLGPLPAPPGPAARPARLDAPALRHRPRRLADVPDRPVHRLHRLARLPARRRRARGRGARLAPSRRPGARRLARRPRLPARLRRGALQRVRRGG